MRKLLRWLGWPAVICIVLAVVLAGFLCFDHHPTVNAPLPPPAATASMPYPTASPARTLPGAGVTASSTAHPSPHSTAAPPTPVGICYPVRVRIPSIKLSQSIKAMGLNIYGQIEPPVKQAIWYDQKGDSTIPGQPGIALFAGHVTFNDVPDSFYHLARVKKGAKILVDCNSGATLTFVVSVKPVSIDKITLEKDSRVWGESSIPKLDLVTCDPDSGKRSDGHYHNNTLVQATLEGAEN